MKWLHRLFNPHCEKCELEDEANKVCNTCEVLRGELSELRIERDRLFEHILHPKSSEPASVQQESNFQPIIPAHIPWHIRRKMLEEQDRAKARAEANAAKPDTANKIANEEVAKLEEELLSGAD